LDKSINGSNLQTISARSIVPKGGDAGLGLLGWGAAVSCASPFRFRAKIPVAKGFFYEVSVETIAPIRAKTKKECARFAGGGRGVRGMLIFCEILIS
jgi:hypothetical protein